MKTTFHCRWKLSCFLFLVTVLLGSIIGCGADAERPTTNQAIIKERPAPTENTETTEKESDTRIVTTSDPNIPTFDNGIQKILIASCAGCHSNPPSEGASTAFFLNIYDDSANAKGAKTMLARIKARTANDSMPPKNGTYTLSNDDKVKILAWVEAGGPLKSSENATNTVNQSDGNSLATNTADGNTSATNTTDSNTESYTGPTPDFYPTVAPMLISACAGCHTDPPAEGASSAFRLDRFDDIDAMLGSYSKRDRISARIEDGSMPPVASSYTLSDANRGAILAWVAAGAPKGDANAAPPTDPSVSFVTPAASGSASNDAITIDLSFTDTDANDTWRLFYTTVAGSTTGGTEINSDLPTSTTSYNWDTAALGVGTYYIYTILTRHLTEYRFSAVGGISVSHPQAGNSSPVVSLTSPNGQNSLLRGVATTVSYTISDPDTGDEASMTYKIELSPDNGSSWTTIIDNHSGSDYTWNIDAGQAQGITYKLRVTANDGKGGITSASSSTAFGIRTSEITYSNTVNNLLSQVCSGCHENVNGSGGKSKYIWDSYSAAKGAYSLRNLMLSEISTGSMPKGGGGRVVTASEKEILQLWIWSGAPEN